MPGHFDARSTADQVLEEQDVTRLRVLITGTSAGLGIETARCLLARGAEVVGTVRDPEKASHATAICQDAAREGGGKFTLVQMDLASLASVRACVAELLAAQQQFDVVIANAGVMATPFGLTEDGFETQFGTNHIGHFALINGVAPLIRSPGRVVCLSSAGHRFADVDLDDPNFERSTYDPFVAYGRSKTANALFAVEFDRRHRERGVRAAAVHPGRIATELSRHMSPEVLARFATPEGEAERARQGFKTIPQGAATTLWAAVTAPAEHVGGKYCEDCHVADVVPESDALIGVTEYAVDGDRAQQLWIRSEELVGGATRPG